jgi:glycosyltransferase involved in cell wall biosynthesis
VRVAVALYTLDAGRATGTMSYVRGLLGELPGAAEVSTLEVHAPSDVLRKLPCVGEIDYRIIPGGHSSGRWRRARHAAALARGRLELQVGRDRRFKQADVVHYPATLPIPATRKPHIVTLHDLQHHDLPQMFSAPQRWWRARAYDEPARNADLVITVSNHARDRIVEVLEIDSARIKVIHPGIDKLRFDGAGAAPRRDRESAGLPEHYALYPASLWPHKNHRTLIEALALVEDERLHLVLTGARYGREAELLAHADRYGVEGRVHHLGFVGDEAMPSLYRCATMLVFPSLYEGFGYPPLEAMACACPVTSSPDASLREVCGDAALFFDPDSPESIATAIDRLSSDGALRRSLVNAGLSNVARFDWKQAATAHALAYREAAG